MRFRARRPLISAEEEADLEMLQERPALECRRGGYDVLVSPSTEWRMAMGKYDYAPRPEETEFEFSERMRGVPVELLRRYAEALPTQ